MDVLQEKLAPFASELNAHLTQTLQQDPRWGAAIVCLAATCVKEMSRQIDGYAHDLQEHLLTLPLHSGINNYYDYCFTSVFKM